MKVGDTKLEACSWCGARIRKVYQPYPASTGVVGFFWDEGACSCIEGLVAGGTIQWRMGRHRNDPRRADDRAMA